MKKLLFLFFGLIIMMSVSVESHAASTTHSHTVCGGSSCSCTSSSHSKLTWTAWDGTTKMYNGNYYLTKDVVLSSTMILDYSYTSYLCLNGHSITCEDTVFDIYSYRSLLITDCKGTGKIESTNADCTIGNNKYLSILGGTIINSSDSYVSVINAYKGTNTAISGGKIECENGTGIYAYPGCKIQVYGGEIYGYNGGIDGHGDNQTYTGSINISGGKVSVPQYRGDAVNFGSGSFTMTGGYIEGSVSVWNASAVTAKVSGGTITGSFYSDVDNTYIIGGIIGGLSLYGESASVSAGTFSGSVYIGANDATISGGDFTGAHGGIYINDKTWICGGYFNNIIVSKGELYLSGVPEIDTLTLYEPGKVYAQNPDSSGSFGGDTVKLALEDYYSDYEWKDGDILVRNVRSDAVASKFTLAEESSYKSLVRSNNNLVLSVLPNGTWGSNVNWYVDTDGTLYIYGDGRVDYVSSGTKYPWYKYVNDIKHVVVQPDITYIPDYTFEYLEKAETIILPETLTYLSLNAFQDCGSLNNIILPASLKSLTGTSVTGNCDFIRCESLTDVYYLGTEEELNAVAEGKKVSSYSSNMTLHYLQFNEGTATCTQAGTLPHYRFDDTSYYDGYYDMEKNLMSGKPESPALGHRVIVQQEAVVDPLNVVNTSFYLQGGKYYSQNKINNSTSSFEIVAEYDCVVTLNYGVSSETNYDKLIIRKNNTQIDAISGNVSNKSVGVPLSVGDVITVSYSKDGSTSSGSDCGWVAIVYEKVNGYIDVDAPAENGEADCTNGVICHYCQAVVKEPLGHRVIRREESTVDPVVIDNTDFSKSGNTYTSQNKSHSSSSSFTITAQYPCTLNLNYGVSSESGYDKLTIKLNGTIKDTISGSVSNKTMTLALSVGDVVTVSYTKDISVNSGSDQGWVTLSYDKVTAVIETDIPADSIEAECGTTVSCDYCQAVIIDGTQHKYEATVTAPTCTEKGYTTYTCACGDSYVADYVDEIGHTHKKEITTPATHLAEGVATFTCTCGDTYTEVIAKTAEHSHEATVTAPTCTEKGYTTYTCACGDSYVADYVDETGHTHKKEITTPATHLAEGVATFTCTCGDTYTEVIAKTTEHSYETKVTAPTCTDKGYTTYTCACGDSYVADYVDANNHSFTNYVYDNNATYLADATKTAKCDNCSETDTVVVEGSKLILGKTESITAVQNTSAIKITWTPVADADGYRVYQMIDGKWVALGNTTKLYATIGNLSQGTIYSFAVKAGKKVNGITVFADKYTTIKTATKAAAPSNVTSVQNTSAIRLDWEATEDVSGFRIYYKSGDIWKICVSATSATYHIFENLKAGAKYTFAIRPYINVDGVVIWGEYAEFTAASKPVNVTSTVSSASKGKITLKWGAVNGAEVYNVYYKSGNGAYKLYKTYSAPQTLSFSGLASGSKYTFAVRAGVNTSSGVVYGGYTPVSVTVK